MRGPKYFSQTMAFFQLFVSCWIFREIFKHHWCFLFEISLCTFCKDHRYTMIQHGNMEAPHGTARHNKAAHLDQRWGNASAETCLLTHFLNENPIDPLVSYDSTYVLAPLTPTPVIWNIAHRNFHRTIGNMWKCLWCIVLGLFSLLKWKEVKRCIAFSASHCYATTRRGTRDWFSFATYR